MQIILYPHGGSGNHGCEAIIRTTAKIINAQYTLFSNCPQEDYKYGLQQYCTIKYPQQNIQHFSLQYLSALIKFHFFNDKNAFDRLSFNPIIKAGRHCDFAFSIGGDNYCYGVPKHIYLVNKCLNNRNCKKILWGCSIEPDKIDNEMLGDLKGYIHIFARESITYEELKNKGLKNISLFPDPAFQLDRKDLPLPNGFIEGNTVGINVSPMIISYEKNKGQTLENYINLMQHIIDTTNMNIALIPHVVWNHNDDRIPLQLLYNRFKDTDRVVMIEDCNAEELKGYIARCRFMVAARTHASIAAYSTCVPTLVVGYSVKAKGIAKDIFNTYDNYVIPVQSLQNKEDLTTSFKWLQENETSIKNHLNNFMPEYCERALYTKQILHNIK